MAQFAYFPTPYPDEVLYSVLCRYHMRTANPGDTTTRIEIWGNKNTARSLYLPTDIGRIIKQLPDGTGITTEKLIWNHTMFPYVKPVLPQKRAEKIFDLMVENKGFKGSIYALAGLSGRKLPLPKYLRFCPECTKEDVAMYGESYWHRVHQLPGVLICPKHKSYILDSPYHTYLIFRQFLPLNTSKILCEYSGEEYSAKIKKQLISFAEDSMWILNNGRNLGYLEDTLNHHKKILVAKKYRNIAENAAIECEKFNSDIIKYYRKDFLQIFNAFHEVTSYRGWAEQFCYKRITPSTVDYLLLMRFLCETPQKYISFNEEYLPFGKGPWPCRNPICKYNLKDCIESIDVKIIHGEPKAIFTCPYCGYSYRRGKAVKKEAQYSGQVKMVDYGWLWKDKLKHYLKVDKYSVHKTAKLLGVCDDTVLIHGIQYGMLPEERMPKKREYKRKNILVIDVDINKTKEEYRKKWLQIIEESPGSLRSYLSKKNQKVYKFLSEKDSEWFEEHSPKPAKVNIDWISRDNSYYQLAIDAVETLKNVKERPQWICISKIANMIGLGNSVYQKKSKLPITFAYLESIVETKTEWRKRKILWAINELHNEGIVPTLYKVQLKSGISRNMYISLRGYAEQEIIKSIEERN